MHLQLIIVFIVEMNINKLNIIVHNGNKFINSNDHYTYHVLITGTYFLKRKHYEIDTLVIDGPNLIMFTIMIIIIITMMIVTIIIIIIIIVVVCVVIHGKINMQSFFEYLQKDF